MFFQIMEIVLWPKITSLGPRRVKFERGRVNVITGASKTGKSAIIPIIDYCLGSDRCSIPVKTIRDATAWFGIVVETSQGQKLFARREPGVQRSTGDMFVMEGSVVGVPTGIEGANTNVEAVKGRLNELSGLSQLALERPDDSASIPGRPSFRDLMAFVFQPQNIVANPEVLFYKTDTADHREKLRAVFPYALGAVTPRVLALQHSLNRLRSDLRRKQRELEVSSQISERWIQDMRGRVSVAQELGLLTSTIPSDASPLDLVNVLRSLLTADRATSGVSAETVSAAMAESIQLQDEEARVSTELVFQQQRFQEMTRLRDSAGRLRQALLVKRDRLKISEWVSALHEESHVCPICGGPEREAREEIGSLILALKETEREAGDLSDVPAAFDREYLRIQEHISRLTERLNALRVRRAVVDQASESLRARRYTSEARARYLGGVEEALSRFDALISDNGLRAEVEQLQNNMSALEAELRGLGIQASLDRALRRVTTSAARILPRLDAERPNDPINLNINDLTIRVGGQGRDDFLWEIGSGANWVSYHLATALALQDVFIEQNDNPVPAFVVVDQPSQVYFPRRVAISEGIVSDEDLDPALRDEDIAAVRRIFRALSDWVGGHDRAAQVIVLDHAGENVWGGLSNVHRVEEWRGGLRLIPETWLT